MRICLFVLIPSRFYSFSWEMLNHGEKRCAKVVVGGAPSIYH